MTHPGQLPLEGMPTPPEPERFDPSNIRPLGAGYEDESRARHEAIVEMRGEDVAAEQTGFTPEIVDKAVGTTEPPARPKSKMEKAREHRLRSRPVESRYTDIGSDTAAIVAAGEAFEASGVDDSSSEEPLLTAEEAKAKIKRIAAVGLVRRTLDDAGNDTTYGSALLRARTERRP